SAAQAGGWQASGQPPSPAPESAGRPESASRRATAAPNEPPHAVPGTASSGPAAAPVGAAEDFFPSNPYLEHDGRVTARRAGLLDKVLVDRGAFVHAGEPLAGIETDEAAQGLALALADEKLARADLDRIRPLGNEKIVSPQDIQRAEI